MVSGHKSLGCHLSTQREIYNNDSGLQGCYRKITANVDLYSIYRSRYQELQKTRKTKGKPQVSGASLTSQEACFEAHN